MSELKAQKVMHAALSPPQRGWQGGLLSFFLSTALHIGGAALLMIEIKTQGAATQDAAEQIVYVSLVEETAPVPDVPEILEMLEKTEIEDEPEIIAPAAGAAPPLKKEKLKEEERKPKKSISRQNNKTSVKTPASAPALSQSTAPESAYAGGSSAAKVRYQDIVRAHINAHRLYPGSARRKKLEGEALVRITIARSGHILYHHFLGGTGHKILDDAILEMLKKADPLPPVPTDSMSAPVDLDIPIGFYLKP